MFLSSGDYLEHVSGVLEAGESVSVAVAFLGDGAERLFERFGKPTRILCNLMTGATNPNVVEALQSVDGVEIRRLDDLHAKVVLTPNKAIVGSANLSTNGLNLEGRESAGWREAGYLVSDKLQIEAMFAWYEKQWAASSEISPKDIELAKQRWKLRRAGRPIATTAKRLLDLELEQLKDQRIYVALYREEASKEAAEVAETRIATAAEAADNAELTSRLSYFEDWSELPTDGPLLCFWYGRRFGLTDDGVWKRRSTFDTSFFADGNTWGIQIVEASNDAGVWVYDRGDARKLAQKLKPVMEKLLEHANDNGSLVMSLHDALSIAKR